MTASEKLTELARNLPLLERNGYPEQQLQRLATEVRTIETDLAKMARVNADLMAENMTLTIRIEQLEAQGSQEGR